MKKNKTIFFNFLVLFCVSFLCNAQNMWPVGTGLDPSGIAGTLGEFRGDNTNPRFHRGTDIIHTNPSVYAINDGLVVINYNPSNCWGSYIT